MWLFLAIITFWMAFTSNSLIGLVMFCRHHHHQHHHRRHGCRCAWTLFLFVLHLNCCFGILHLGLFAIRWFIDEVAQFEWFENFFCAQNQCLFCLYMNRFTILWIVVFFSVCLYFCNMFPLILIYLKLFLRSCIFQLNVDIMSMCQSNLQFNLNICVSKNSSAFQVSE